MFLSAATESAPGTQSLGDLPQNFSFFLTSNGPGRGGDLGDCQVRTDTASCLRKAWAQETKRGGRT